MNNNDSFAMIDNVISLYANGLLTVQETTEKALQAINNATDFIWDPGIKQKAKNVLYKRFFDKMHKAIVRMNRQ